MDLATIKPKRSVKLTDQEFDSLKKLIAENGLLEATFVLKVDRATLHRVQLVGSGSERIITIIRENLPQ